MEETRTSMRLETVEALLKVGAPHPQAMAIATAIPDIEPLRGEMERMEGRLVKWMVGIFITFTTLLGGWITVPVIQLGLFV